MNLIKTFGDFAVSFNSDGYLNATQIAKQFDKRINNYLRSEQTQLYITALLDVLKARNSAMTENQLVIVQKGGNVHFSGTWLHPKLAVDFARWLDPKFAVWCDEQIEQIISGSLQLEKPQPTKTAIENELRGLLMHFPYMFAYFQRTHPAVRRLNRSIVYRTHDRFGDAAIFARQIADKLGIPMKSWREIMCELEN